MRVKAGGYRFSEKACPREGGEHAPMQDKQSIFRSIRTEYALGRAHAAVGGAWRALPMVAGMQE
jgi:hypothetical protein